MDATKVFRPPNDVLRMRTIIHRCQRMMQEAGIPEERIREYLESAEDSFEDEAYRSVTSRQLVEDERLFRESTPPTERLAYSASA